MKNFIILELQGYKPTNGNLSFIWKLLSNDSRDTQIRKRLDRPFDMINMNSNMDDQEKVFFKAFRELVSHFRVESCGRRITAVERMNYTNAEYTYKLHLGKRRCSYFDSVRKIPKLEIRNEEVV